MRPVLWAFGSGVSLGRGGMRMVRAGMPGRPATETPSPRRLRRSVSPAAGGPPSHPAVTSAAPYRRCGNPRCGQTYRTAADLLDAWDRRGAEVAARHRPRKWSEPPVPYRLGRPDPADIWYCQVCMHLF